MKYVIISLLLVLRMKKMYKDIIAYLKIYKNATISLSELENQVPGNVNYEEFATIIKTLINNNILAEKNGKNNNGKKPPLAFRFSINRYELNKEHKSDIQKFYLESKVELDLQEYLRLNEEIWKDDLPYIKKVEEYIFSKGMPKDFVTAQERSFHITFDEKWIDEKGGKKVLERMKLWDKLNIISAGEPLMLAVNPEKFNSGQHHHLIVENKATFMALLEDLHNTNFTSLIFGSGWKITANINMLEKQLGLSGVHKLYYFGDLDNEGITIWNALNQRVEAIVAVDFYRELLKKPFSIGKENQLKRDEALQNFLANFSEEEQIILSKILDKGGYLPQEGLNKDELNEIWRNIYWE